MEYLIVYGFLAAWFLGVVLWTTARERPPKWYDNSLEIQRAQEEHRRLKLDRPAPYETAGDSPACMPFRTSAERDKAMRDHYRRVDRERLIDSTSRIPR